MEGITDDQLNQFQKDGYVCPVSVLSGDEVSSLYAHVERHERDHGPLSNYLGAYPHLTLTWIDQLIRHPALLDAMESILGPNLLVWGSNFFVKEPRSPHFISWHQDSTYWGLSPADVATAWLALTDSDAENGCVRVLPGSQKVEQIPHRDTYAADNMLSRGQEISVNVDEGEAADLVLNAGEMSIHHVRVVHGSRANKSDRRRIGLAIRFVPTYVRQTTGMRDRATLVRGEDLYGYFEREQRPEADLDTAALAFHAQVMEEQKKILYR